MRTDPRYVESLQLLRNCIAVRRERMSSSQVRRASRLHAREHLNELRRLNGVPVRPRGGTAYGHAAV